MYPQTCTGGSVVTRRLDCKALVLPWQMFSTFHHYLLSLFIRKLSWIPPNAFMCFLFSESALFVNTPDLFHKLFSAVKITNHKFLLVNYCLSMCVNFTTRHVHKITV